MLNGFRAGNYIPRARCSVYTVQYLTMSSVFAVAVHARRGLTTPRMGLRL